MAILTILGIILASIGVAFLICVAFIHYITDDFDDWDR